MLNHLIGNKYLLARIIITLVIIKLNDALWSILVLYRMILYGMVLQLYRMVQKPK